MTLAKDFLGYISKPYFYRSEEKLSLKTLPRLGALLLAKFIIIVAVYFAIIYLFGSLDSQSPDRAGPSLRDYGPGRAFKLIIILPFLEELFFRAWLRRRGSIKIMFPVVTCLSVWFLARFFGLAPSPLMLGCVAVSFLLYFIWIYRSWATDMSDRFIDRIFPFVFWISALIFALMHLTNYKVENIGPLDVLIVTPQFIAGIFYGYIVKRYGFWAAFGCHAVWNGSLMVIAQAL